MPKSNYDKVTRCRPMLKNRPQGKCFPVTSAKLLRSLLSQNTSRRLFVIISVSIVLKRSWQTKLCYDTEIKAYQFEPKVGALRKFNPGEKTGLTHHFEEARNIVKSNFQAMYT